MQWNQLEYSFQQKIIDKIVSLLEGENNEEIQDGIIAALHELELWSNSPILIKTNDDFEEMLVQANWDL